MENRDIPYILHGERQDTPSPVVFDNPHSGIHLPDHFNYACTHDKIMRFRDAHIEQLLTGVPGHGIPVLEATIHRGCVDLNRHAHEINPDAIPGGWNEEYELSYYTKNGRGVIPYKLGFPEHLKHIYNKHAKPDTAEIKHRIETYHRPYHDKLEELVDRAHKTHGMSLHIDMHSMARPWPPKAADIILGDMDGQSCAPVFVERVAEFFRNEGYSVDFNGMFKGAALIQKTGLPDQDRHSLQIEMARDLYMDQETMEFDPDGKGTKLRDVLTRLAADLHAYSLDYAAELARASLNTPDQDDFSASSTSPKDTDRPKI